MCGIGFTAEKNPYVNLLQEKFRKQENSTDLIY
jgi:hypothetical protein